MAHYNFDKELQPYAHFHTPLNAFVLTLAQKTMGLLYHLEHSKKSIKVSSRKVENVRVLIYEPSTATSACMLFFHGGGFVFNAASHHFSLVRKFVVELGMKCVFVDYRLAPKYKFPCAVEDCFEVYKWVVDNASALVIDAKKIVVCGDSAGGNLAAVTCLKARDEGLQMPVAQMLLYPVIDHKMQTQSYAKYKDTPMCNSKDMAKYYKYYLPADVSSPSPYLSPIEAENLKHLPPTYIEVAQYDCLHDEGVSFAKALRDAGVDVELHEVCGAMHGYDIAQNSAFIQKLMAQRCDFLRKYTI